LPPCPATAAGAVWDLWCRVIDNHGDIGVCWRLARTLAAQHGLRVRLFTDDASALAWIAPHGAAGVEVLPWPADSVSWPEAGDVVIEAFGCDPPAAYIASMSARPQPPVWLNLEYLSAEPYVERSHRLPSPQRGGLTKWFFYPGFTERTGGLLRESGLMADRARFDTAAWLTTQGIARQPGERLVSLFCYPDAPFDALLRHLADAPTLLLATPGPAQQGVASWQARHGPLPASLRVHALPWLPQPSYDRLLWACDLNIVRGEDSLVRALWAGAPFLWHIYAQQDGVHLRKLQAFLQQWQPPQAVACYLPGFNRGPADAAFAGQALPDLGAWAAAVRAWRHRLLLQPPLDEQLLAFVAGRFPRPVPDPYPDPSRPSAKV
jgi:uncharacterized repeat protein (TIGR03837 family)